ncbi:MAG: hypothetical protein J2P21_18520 [Chloracidobacterium sp.]|nr:hypothetical protein [Chloracidobacterium sp.]
MSQSEIPVYFNLNPNLRLLGFTAANAKGIKVYAGKLSPVRMTGNIEAARQAKGIGSNGAVS